MRCALSILWLTVACGSAPQPPADGMAGEDTPIEVLDAGFVRFEGERCALEWFLLDMRERVRANPAAPPHVIVNIRPQAPGVDGQWVSMLRSELHKAGIRHMTLGSSGG